MALALAVAGCFSKSIKLFRYRGGGSTDMKCSIDQPAVTSFPGSLAGTKRTTALRPCTFFWSPAWEEHGGAHVFGESLVSCFEKGWSIDVKGMLPCAPAGELYSTYVRKSLYGSEKHCRPAGSFFWVESWTSKWGCVAKKRRSTPKTFRKAQYFPQSEGASICINLLSQYYRVIIWLHDWHLAGFIHLVWSWPLSTCTREGSSTEIWSPKICFSPKKANSRCPAVCFHQNSQPSDPQSSSPSLAPNILQVTDMGHLAQYYSNRPNWDCGPDFQKRLPET